MPGFDETARQAQTRDAERRRAATGMVGAALLATRNYPDSAPVVLEGLVSYGPEWLKDDKDPRGMAFREYVATLVAVVDQADAGRAAS